jgi:hypothetical protein
VDAVRSENFHMLLDRHRCDHVLLHLLGMTTRADGGWFLSLYAPDRA